MKIYTSYFYQIRFFTPNMLPVSTAVWDPKWFHKNKDQSYKFLDKNGVVNGCRAEMMHPREDNHNCPCEDKNSDNCLFKRKYFEQLNSLDAKKIISSLEKYLLTLKEKYKWEGEPVIVFIVHEAPDNPCSERSVIQKWLKDCGYDVEEWKKDD